MRAGTERPDYAGKTVALKDGLQHHQFPGLDSSEVEVEGYWDEVAGRSWMFSDGNPACLIYAMRSAICGLPTDDRVLYAKYRGLGVLVHVSEVEREVEEGA